LVCIEKLDSLIDTKEPKLADYQKLFLRLEDSYTMYLALLLHDTGKSSAARHHAEASALNAQKVAARLQLPPDRRRRLILLVDHHMTLSEIAQRRNLEDPATIADFAEVVRSPENLDALMLLTLADGKGTGGQNWSDWKESLVWHLHHATSSYLHDEREFFRERHIEREGLHQSIARRMAKDFGEEIEVHFHSMPDRYFQAHRLNEIIGHIRLFRSFLEARSKDSALALSAAIKWHTKPDQGHSECWICTWDRTGLVAKIAGSFATASINILSADAYTRSDSLMLGIFRVCNTDFRPVSDERDIEQVESVLQDALEVSEFDFGPLLAKARRKMAYYLPTGYEFPTKLAISNDIHPQYTVIDLQTADRLGLLYDVLRCLSQAGINIALSRIATEKGAAFDSFYVTDLENKKILDRERLANLKRSLLVAAVKE
jgi:[protein-PII] uridylyltransferase